VFAGTAEDVKFKPVTLLPLTVVGALAGVTVKPLLVGVTVYEPLARLVKLKLPELSAVVVAVAAPPRVTVVAAPLDAGLTVPEML
jgi:hypothetical protein